MAAALRAAKGLRLAVGPPNLGERQQGLALPFTRSAFVAKRRNHDQPNWFGVGLAFSTSAALWALLFKQHNEDVMEYERRKEERQHKCTGCS
ncbi:NADH dehydrogenase [ubiquinone] 1 subunit C1, mitochondrial isoform X2 [Grus americana]|uniref:NADH dehydrogenase [ubiquinone] 1 subunit C1, mitochondrial isoform X1 n=1 Tax=Grus americana TaxID=9117 RepID=UPI0024089012|nr:NADH dehydrogenase [ubiquinone] 1 subunit C1, mitochondrial isoform X1 [Grus americana]XP_054681710.1 NADH dehydrogenase [ubiquinone] 1 subunit C1, mitochondrial isoform X2 [Grus americana]